MPPNCFFKRNFSSKIWYILNDFENLVFWKVVDFPFLTTAASSHQFSQWIIKGVNVIPIEFPIRNNCLPNIFGWWYYLLLFVNIVNQQAFRPNSPVQVATIWLQSTAFKSCRDTLTSASASGINVPNPAITKLFYRAKSLHWTCPVIAITSWPVPETIALSLSISAWIRKSATHSRE